MADANTEVSCTNCTKPTTLPICDDCAADRYKGDPYCEACDTGGDNTRDDELEDVLEYLKQKAVDRYRTASDGAADSMLTEIRLALERGDHR